MKIIILENTINVYRQELVSGNKGRYTTYTVSLDCTIQPLGMVKTAQIGGSFGKMFNIFLDVDQNIEPGDILVDKDGNRYKIESGGIENRNDGMIADYMVVVCKKIN